MRFPKDATFVSQMDFLSRHCFTGITKSALYSIGILGHKKAGVYQMERDNVLYAIAIWGGKKTYVAKWVKGPGGIGVWETLLGVSFPSLSGEGNFFRESV